MNILELLFNSFVLYPLEMHRKYGFSWTFPVILVVLMVVGGFVWWYGSFKSSYGLPSNRNADKTIFDSNR